MNRVTLDPDFDMNSVTPVDAATNATTNAVNAGIHRAIFDRMFRWNDDLAIPVPDDDEERPRQMINALDRNGQALGAAWPTRGNIDGVNPAVLFPPPRLPLDTLTRQSMGLYTWMVTITPTVEGSDFRYETDGDPNTYEDYDGDGVVPDFFTNLDRKPLYDVSVVVFYDRDLSYPPLPDKPPEERLALVPQASFFSLGYGGGEVALFGNPGEIDVEKDQWLLLCGMHGPKDASGNAIRPDLWRNVFKWYRIVAAADASEDTNANGTLDAGEDLNGNSQIDAYRAVTLTGPDWDINWCVALNGDPGLEAQAVLFNGILGVYTTTTELDAN
jgi:hypothetical protein